VILFIISEQEPQALGVNYYFQIFFFPFALHQNNIWKQTSALILHHYIITSNILTLATGTAIPAVSFYVIIIFHQVVVAEEEEEEEEEEDENLTLLPNLRIYGVIKVVTIVTTPTIGNTEDVIAPTS
jgi:hypothetical protein